MLQFAGYGYENNDSAKSSSQAYSRQGSKVELARLVRLLDPGSLFLHSTFATGVQKSDKLGKITLTAQAGYIYPPTHHYITLWLC